MALSTKTIDLVHGTPVDLVADVDVAAAIAAAADGIGVFFLQNVGTTIVCYSEQDAEPTTGDHGHQLAARDGFVLTLTATDRGWIWPKTASGGRVAVTAAE